MVVLGIGLVSLGLFFFLSSAIGLIRFPDCYCRMHATGKADTMGILFCLLGLALFVLHKGLEGERLLLVIKILFIGLFWFIGGPTATHALLRSAFERGVRPWTKDGKEILEWPEGES